MEHAVYSHPLRGSTQDLKNPEVRLLAAELLPAFYDQLKNIAQRTRSRLGGTQTLQTTALVHESWLRLQGAGQVA